MNSSVQSLINKYIHTGPLTDEIIFKHGLVCKAGHIKIGVGNINNHYYMNKYLGYACLYGNKRLINLMRKRGAHDTNYGLEGACEGGHIDIIKLMITQSPSDTYRVKSKIMWDWGLRGACKGGHMEIVKLMINPFSTDELLNLIHCISSKKGATDWDYGLQGACEGGHIEIAKFMIELGAKNWNMGLYAACRGGHIELVKLMVGLAGNATDWNEGLYEACKNGHKEIVKLMIDPSSLVGITNAEGANSCSYCCNRNHEF